jgi:hypothetical protein
MRKITDRWEVLSRGWHCGQRWRQEKRRRRRSHNRENLTYHTAKRRLCDWGASSDHTVREAEEVALDETSASTDHSKSASVGNSGGNHRERVLVSVVKQTYLNTL